MSNKQQGQYEVIASRYDEIFPMNPVTLALLQRQAGGPGAQVLDIACGNAAYTIALAENGCNMVGVDLDPGMIQAAKERLASHAAQIQNMKRDGDASAATVNSHERTMDTFPQHLAIRLLEGNMLHLDALDLVPMDMTYCIGNSLVHLQNPSETLDFLKKTLLLLKQGGRLVLQILNYDRILDQHVTALPLIHDKEGRVLFERLYEYPQDIIPQARTTPQTCTTLDSHIDHNCDQVYAYPIEAPIVFHTRLHTGGEVLENRIPLVPVRSATLHALLEKAGFREIRLFGDFKETPYKSETSYALVVTARK